MNQRLHNAVVCPKCFGKLDFDAAKNGYICQHDHLFYPVRDGIPVLLEDEATPLAAESE